jgi:anti-sigma-K factor RskA
MSPELNRHMGEEEIERYSMGTLSEDEQDRAEQHLLLCESCQDLVKQEDTFLRAVRAAGSELVRGGESREPARRRETGRLTRVREAERVPFWRRPVFAFALAAVVLLVVFAGIRRNDRAVAAPIAVGLQVTRGDTNLTTAPAGKPLMLQPDVATLPPQASYRVDVVDQGGGVQWNGEGKLQDSKLSVTVPGMNAGVYFVRVYSADGQLLREYGLEVSR